MSKHLFQLFFGNHAIEADVGADIAPLAAVTGPFSYSWMIAGGRLTV
ncbi:unnamed protein product [Urochloa humidicola]